MHGHGQGVRVVHTVPHMGAADLNACVHGHVHGTHVVHTPGWVQLA